MSSNEIAMLKSIDDEIREYFFQTARDAGVSEDEIERVWSDRQAMNEVLPEGDWDNLHPGNEGEPEGSYDRMTQRRVGSEDPDAWSSARALPNDEGTFRGTPFNEVTGFTTGEPMDLAWRLLKEDVDESFKQMAWGGLDEGWHDHLPEDFDHEGFDAENYNEIIEREYPTGQSGYNPGMKDLRRSQYNHYESPEENEKRFRDLMDNPTREPILVVRDKNGEEHIIAGHHRMAANIESGRPHLPALILDMNKDIQTGEPMEIAFQLLKGRVSPEARQHKLEYDTKYESSPKRVKYREDLNRERRRRGIYGAGDGKDVSHTEGGKLTLEGVHSNRARHFKDKGTLRPVAVKKSKQLTLPEFMPEEIRDAHSKSRLPSLTLGTKPGSDTIDRRQAEELSNRMLAELGKLNFSSIISAEGGSEEYTKPGETEPSFTIPNVTPEQEKKLQELAKVYGQKEIMYTGGQDKPSFKDPEGNVTEQYNDSRITADKPEYFTNYPGSGLYQTLN